MSLAFMDSALVPLKSLAHAVVPAGSVAFDLLAWLSLVFYLIFAVVALYYALKPWAGKTMAVAIGAATVASLVLHLSLLSSPSYVGAGALWKFVALSQYLPWAVISLGVIYLLNRWAARWRKSRT